MQFEKASPSASTSKVNGECVIVCNEQAATDDESEVPGLELK